MAIKAKNISKSFGKLKVLESLELNIQKGSVHGFLGPNGAGKTTVIRILLGLLSPDTAEIEIMGHDLFLQRDLIMSKVGAIVEYPAFFEYLTAYENLLYLSRLSFHKINKATIENALKIAGLTEVKNKKVLEFSYGMKQRLGIALAMLPDNELIFLDEPANGLDPYGIVDMRKLIRTLSEEYGITIFISSHLLSEVEQTCDFVTIIDKGKKVCEDKVADLMRKHESLEIITPDKEKFMAFATNQNLKIIYEAKEKYGIKYFVEGREEQIPELTKKLINNNIRVFKTAKHQKILEDIFVEVTSSKNAGN
ncbi:MAG: hypothetical protein A2017_03275 [Lentisphaerae bacterium GWF2_44_16]|nr:MAG: hypothetical protein A2017_03275 [Lentisphaerae bacterium GWF2_44_16]